MAITPQTLRSLARSLASLLIGLFCATVGFRPAHAAEPVTYLLPAAPSQPAFAPWLIARQLGYYTDAGYDVHFATAKGGTEVAQQIAIGQAAVGGAIGDTPIFMRNYGVHVKTIATLGAGSLTVIVAGQDRGIHALQDLRGKRLTVLSRTDSTYHALIGALASVGLSTHDVTIDTAAPKVIVRRVLTGASDACACIPDWKVQIMQAQPEAVLLPTAGAFPSMAQAILASDRSITGQPAMLKAVVAATLHGMRFIMDDPRKAADIFIQAVPAQKGQEDLIARILRAYVDQAYAGQAIAGETDPKRLEGLQRFYLSQHLVRNEVPVEELYTNEFIPPEE